ncbi:YrhB family protein [Streptomyces sp. NBC_01003]|nr:YrhB family protein [Streptomyces sp. NBC_01003]
MVSWDSEEFVRTRNSQFMPAGNGPYLVDRVDGGLHQIGVVSAATGGWEADYRARIRVDAATPPGPAATEQQLHAGVPVQRRTVVRDEQPKQE